MLAGVLALLNAFLLRCVHAARQTASPAAYLPLQPTTNEHQVTQ